MKKYKIGVFGSASHGLSIEEARTIARQLGKKLGEYADQVIVITGACTGLPYIVAFEAAHAGSEVWGFSPVVDVKKQKEFTPDDDLSIYANIQFVPSDFPHLDNRRICFKYRNVLSTAECDAGIVISGQWGSLNEFTNLVDMQKVVGVLTGTGGIADELPTLTQKITKEGQGKIIFNDDPEMLVQALFTELDSSKIA